jgi:hypothetical protein
MKTCLSSNRSNQVTSETLLSSPPCSTGIALSRPNLAINILPSHQRMLAIILSLLFSPLVFSADPPITTAELARHLGVSIWRISRGELPDTYKVMLYHVKDGKLTKDYLLGEFTKHGDLLLCTRWLVESASVSVDDGDTIFSTKAALSSRPVFATENKFQGLGIPLLLCYQDPKAANAEEWHRGSLPAAREQDYSKATGGLAIVITKVQP